MISELTLRPEVPNTPANQGTETLETAKRKDLKKQQEEESRERQRNDNKQ